MNNELYVGMPCTTYFYSDCNPAEIVEIVNDRTIRVRSMDYKVIKGSEHNGSAEYEYFSDPNGPVSTFTKRKNGNWVQKGSSMRDGKKCNIGYARRYYDPHF